MALEEHHHQQQNHPALSAELIQNPCQFRVTVVPEVVVKKSTAVLGAFAPNLIATVGCDRKEGLKLRHKAMIWGMYVMPEWRGRALGRALLMAAIARAREVAGLEQLLLQLGIANAAAAALYKSLGFAAYGMEPRGLKIGDRYCDEYLMMLELSGKYGLE